MTQASFSTGPFIAAAAAVSISSPAAAQPSPGPPAVGVVEVTKRPITESTEFLGRIEAVNRVNVAARVTAFLEKRLFTEGAEVVAAASLSCGDIAPRENAEVDCASLVSRKRAVRRASARHTRRRSRALAPFRPGWSGGSYCILAGRTRREGVRSRVEVRSCGSETAYAAGNQPSGKSFPP